MADKFLIHGGRALRGTIEVRGSKNAATPIIAATLLTSEKCRISNLPLVLDVYRMIEILQDMGASISWVGKRTVEIQNKSVDPSRIKKSTMKKLRSSVLFLGPILARFGSAKMYYPGGCSIGARPIKAHLEAFEDLGAKIKLQKDYFSLELPRNQKLPQKVILNEFSVTATENVLSFLALRPDIVTVSIAASEPHISDLSEFLKKMGARIKGAGTPIVTVSGMPRLQGASYKIIPDYIEAGTFLLGALATGGSVKIKNVPVGQLDLVLKKLFTYGANIKVSANTIEVLPGSKMRIEKIQAMPHPGIPTDLQPQFGVLATQSSGGTLLHDPLYEGRLNHLRELNKMGARIKIHDPHRATIQGPTKLKGGVELAARDLRGGAALLIAALMGRGTTTLSGIEHIERGYEDIDERLRSIGADITKIKTDN